MTMHMVTWSLNQMHTTTGTIIYCIKNPHKPKACILFQWNIETYKLYRKINLWKFTKSKRFNCFTCFETLKQTKNDETCFETNWNKALEMVKIPSPISGVSKHYWNGLKHEENWSPNISVVSKQNWNKLWKRWKYQAPYLVFRNIETMGLYREIIETDCKMEKIG